MANWQYPDLKEVRLATFTLSLPILDYAARQLLI